MSTSKNYTETYGCRIIEQGAGFSGVRVGAYIAGDGELYRVTQVGSGIYTDEGRGNYVQGMVEHADWDACPECDVVQALVVLDNAAVAS